MAHALERITRWQQDELTSDIVAAAVHGRLDVIEKIVSHVNHAVGKEVLTNVQSMSKISQKVKEKQRVGLKAVDNRGLTALHVAASCDQPHLVEWLVENGMGGHEKDTENGWTPLHRAVYHASIRSAVNLIASKCPMYATDREGYASLDLIALDHKADGLQLKAPGNAFSWGLNSNFNLGHAEADGHAYPEMITALKGTQTRINDIVVAKYHTLFLTEGGQVLSCGFGRGGRLGHGDERAYLEPTLIKSLSGMKVVAVAASKSHSAVVNSSGRLFVFGLNSEAQLGIPPTQEQKILMPQAVKSLKGKQVIGLAVSNIHTICFTCNEVYSFGSNKGQLGHARGDDRITQPRIVSYMHMKYPSIVAATASEDMSALMTENLDVVIMRNYNCFKLSLPFSRFPQEIKISRREKFTVSRLVAAPNDTLFVLNMAGDVWFWKEIEGVGPVMQSIDWAIPRRLRITDIAASHDKLMLVTDLGHVYWAKFGDVLKAYRKRVPMQRVEMIDHVFKISTDTSGGRFGALRSIIAGRNADLNLLIPQSNVRKDLAHLLETAEPGDGVTDIALVVGEGKELRFAHKFVLASRSRRFREILTEKKGEDSWYSFTVESPIDLSEALEESVADWVLYYLYTGQLKDEAFNAKGKDRAALLKAADALQLPALSSLVNGRMRDDPTLSFDLVGLEDFCDIEVRIGDQDTVQLHKCILVARSQYAHAMLFGSPWSESHTAEGATIGLPTHTDRKTFEIVRDFFYTDSLDLSEYDLQQLFNIMAIANEMMCEDLKNLCEFNIALMLDVRNVSAVIDAADVFAAENLIDQCLRYIYANLEYLLSHRSLEQLPMELLDRISYEYRHTGNKILRGGIGVNTEVIEVLDEIEPKRRRRRSSRLVSQGESSESSRTVTPSASPLLSATMAKQAMATPLDTFSLMSVEDHAQGQGQSNIQCSPKTKQQSIGGGSTVPSIKSSEDWDLVSATGRKNKNRVKHKTRTSLESVTENLLSPDRGGAPSPALKARTIDSHQNPLQVTPVKSGSARGKSTPSSVPWGGSGSRTGVRKTSLREVMNEEVSHRQISPGSSMSVKTTPMKDVRSPSYAGMPSWRRLAAPSAQEDAHRVASRVMENAWGTNNTASPQGGGSSNKPGSMAAATLGGPVPISREFMESHVEPRRSKMIDISPLVREKKKSQREREQDAREQAEAAARAAASAVKPRGWGSANRTTPETSPTPTGITCVTGTHIHSSLSDSSVETTPQKVYSLREIQEQEMHAQEQLRLRGYSSNVTRGPVKTAWASPTLKVTSQSLAGRGRRSLDVVQMEDNAIKQLAVLYKTDGSEDDYIEIQRVSETPLAQF
eukprot:Clim_evm20s239 gene=Clim_evmTU20s239